MLNPTIEFRGILNKLKAPQRLVFPLLKRNFSRQNLLVSAQKTAIKANIKQPASLSACSVLTEWRSDSLWQVSNVVMKHKSGSNERTSLILVVSLERSLTLLQSLQS